MAPSWALNSILMEPMVGGGGGCGHLLECCVMRRKVWEQRAEGEGQLWTKPNGPGGILPFQALVSGSVPCLRPRASLIHWEHQALSLWPLPALLSECAPISQPQHLSRFSLLTINTNPVISPLSQHLPLDLSCLLFPFHQPWAPPVVYLAFIYFPSTR